MFSMAMWMAAIIGPVQIGLGDLHGVNSYHHQPQKVAAMEGQFETEQGARSLLFRLAGRQGRGDPVRAGHSEAGQPLPDP